MRNSTIDPDEVLLDAFNLPSFDTNQFEGRVERSIKGRVPLAVGVFGILIFAVFFFQVWNLQVTRGEAIAVLSQQNRLDQEVLFAERGVLFDRNGAELVWNVVSPDDDPGAGLDTFSLRTYTTRNGFSHLLGFVGYPEKDSSGFWWRTEYLGKAGLESTLDNVLQGKNGRRIIEVDALNNIQSQNILTTPIAGSNVVLSIDAAMQEALFNAIRNGARNAGFVGGAGIIMDIHTGEILALTSYPEYSSQVMTDGSDIETIRSYATQKGQPFLNRVVTGEYTPGSIVKPYIAAAALQEGLVRPTTEFLSTGEIRIPNPYSPGNDSVFRDWRAQGWVDVVDALAVSSNVYFYIVGGGFQNQQGLGIERLAAYATRFGLGQPTGIAFGTEAVGVVPTPSWKVRVFGEDDPWRLGNTYHTSIGQFGFLMTPVQAVRYIAAVGNGGTLLTPHLQKDMATEAVPTGVSDTHLAVVRSGMRESVQRGVAAALNISGVNIAAKTGTAQLGFHNEHMNSWVVGFWPADKPQFAFAVVLEKAPADTLQGAAPALRSFFEWMVREEPEYARGKYPDKATTPIHR